MTRIRIPRPNKGGSNVFTSTLTSGKGVAGEPSERIGYRNPLGLIAGNQASQATPKAGPVVATSGLICSEGWTAQ